MVVVGGVIGLVISHAGWQDRGLMHGYCRVSHNQAGCPGVLRYCQALMDLLLLVPTSDIVTNMATVNPGQGMPTPGIKLCLLSINIFFGGPLEFRFLVDS